ncbi:hypothetical protein VNO77_39245 [Canavalia gladiata]|uniref:Uncharacterized protein n=1 Tax=Canavalia gladiata TaxID=3824 RepID=A0AAN9KAR6_CANGL
MVINSILSKDFYCHYIISLKLFRTTTVTHASNGFTAAAGDPVVVGGDRQNRGKRRCIKNHNYYSICTMHTLIEIYAISKMVALITIPGDLQEIFDTAILQWRRL